MSTRWSAAPYHQGADWLMTDGTVVKCPMIETTPSQRRWRVQGTNDSVAKHDLGSSVARYMHSEASRLGKHVWLEIDTPDADFNLHKSAMPGCHGFSFDSEPELNLAERGTIAVGFEFRCTEYPQLTAMLWVTLTTARNQAISMASAITYRSTDPGDAKTHTHVRYIDTDQSIWRVPEIAFPLSTQPYASNPRKAVEAFAETLRMASDVDTLTLPDGRGYSYGPSTGVLHYEFTRSNYSKDLYRKALDLIDSGPSMERLNQLLREVRTELRKLGVVADLKEQFDVAGLLNGRLSELQLQLRPQDVYDGHSTDSEAGLDPHHRVVLDLANGVFATTCSRQNLEDVAAAWEVAKFKAEISGETEVLLAYAEAFNLKAEQDRLRKIIVQRKTTSKK